MFLVVHLTHCSIGVITEVGRRPTREEAAPQSSITLVLLKDVLLDALPRTPVDDCVGGAVRGVSFSSPYDRVLSWTVCRATLGIIVERRHRSNGSVNAFAGRLAVHPMLMRSPLARGRHRPAGGPLLLAMMRSPSCLISWIYSRQRKAPPGAGQGRRPVVRHEVRERRRGHRLTTN